MICYLLIAGGCAAACANPDTKHADMAGHLIGKITIKTGGIFDLSNPQEDKALFRLANKVHITTRQNVIRNQLLFSTGESFSAQKIEESERLLRKNRYLQTISIQPTQGASGLVDIDVITTDSWTLTPIISASRSGGENKTALGFKELNLFGSGVAVEFFRRTDVDRDSSTIKITDRNIGRSWYALSLRVENNNDGHLRFLSLGKPFYSLHSRRTRGIIALDVDQIEHFYDLGEDLAQYRHQSNYREVYFGWSKGLLDGWSKRFTTGITYDEHRFSAASILPQDRKFVYPFFGIELLQDRYEKTMNYEQLNIVEDRFLGTRLSLRLGLAHANFGSDRDAWLYKAVAQTAFEKSAKTSVLLAAVLDGRLEDAGVRNLSLDLSARYYKRQSQHRLLFIELSGIYGHNLDLDRFLLLGGNSGLRGYPLRYQTGDRRALLTVEQRFFSNWYPFRLFHVGAAIFFDIGRTWGDGPVSPAAESWLKDVGFGLRIGNTRLALGKMIHVDLAFPLDGKDDIKSVQFLVSTKKKF